MDPFRCLFHTAMPCTLMTCNCCECGVLGVVEFQVLSIVNFICKAVKEDFCHFSPVKDRVIPTMLKWSLYTEITKVLLI